MVVDVLRTTIDIGEQVNADGRYTVFIFVCCLRLAICDKADHRREKKEDAKSWYVGANINSKLHKTLFYFGGIPTYINALNKEIEEGFPSHVLSLPKEVVA